MAAWPMLESVDSSAAWVADSPEEDQGGWTGFRQLPLESAANAFQEDYIPLSTAEPAAPSDDDSDGQDIAEPDQGGTGGCCQCCTCYGALVYRQGKGLLCSTRLESCAHGGIAG